MIHTEPPSSPLPPFTARILTQHYRPESVGTAMRAARLATVLHERGVDVQVVTGVPNHPSMTHTFDRVAPGLSHERHALVQRLPVLRFGMPAAKTRRPSVHRTTRPSPGRIAFDRHAKMLRLLTYGSWFVQGARAGARTLPPADVLVAVSPLPTLALGLLLARRDDIPLVLDIQDIWPDAALRAGIVEDPMLVRVLEIIERRVYAGAARIVVLSEGFETLLHQRGVPKERLVVIPNGTVLREERAGTHRRGLRAQWGIPDDAFLVVYAGNLGAVQDLDVLLDAFAALRRHPDIRLVLVGEGVERARLTQRIRDEKLDAVLWRPATPVDRMPEVLAAADAAFLSLKPNAYSPGTIPSKLYDYLAAGLPILNMVEGSAAKVIASAQAGFNLKSGDAAALRVALFSLYADPALRRAMGKAGRQWVGTHASMDVVGNAYLDTLKKVIDAARGT